MCATSSRMTAWLTASSGDLPQAKRSMAGDQHHRDRNRIEIFEAPHNAVAGIRLVGALDFFLAQWRRAGNRVLCSNRHAWFQAPESRGAPAPRTRHSANGCGQPRRSAETPYREPCASLCPTMACRLPSIDVVVEIDHHHMLGPHLVIGHSGGLDHHQAALAVDAADIAPCVEDNTPPIEFQIGFADRLSQLLQRHMHCSVSPRGWRS